MVLKLYGWGPFTCTKRVATILREKQVPFELIGINPATAEHKSPEYLKIQPFGQTPYIDDDGFILYESRAICRYIAQKYKDQGTPLIPFGDPKKLALFEQAASIETAHFDPQAGGLVAEKIFKEFFGQTPDPVALTKYRENLDAKFAVYDKILSKTKYLAGDELSAVDLFHLSYGSLLSSCGQTGLEDGKYPNVNRWWKDITARPSWQANKEEVKSVASY